MKKTLLALLAITAPLFAHADLIWYEGFNYANGGITNVSAGTWLKFSGATNLGSCDMTNNNNILEVAATSAPNGSSRQDDCRRPLATAAGSPYTNSVQVLYAGFTVLCTNLPNGAGSYFASFHSTANGFFGRVQAFTNGSVLPNTWRIGASANSLATNAANGGYPVDLALNTPYKVIVELDPTPSGLKAATVWVNPVDITDTGSASTDTKYTTSDTIGTASTSPVNGFAFRQASSFGNAFFQITNLALATTFAEAFTNITKTNAIAPAIVYQPVVGVSNFVGSSFSLSAVANGQGQGNLTYQWQKSAAANNSSPANVTNPNGNSNILPFSNVQTTDSGYYSLVVTTPFGLSTTSSLSKVFVSAAPVPPSFTSQPVSQSVYRGQTIVFSCTVVSPGNVNYQWRSNGVAIVGETAASLTLPSVTTNFSASYSVAVSNDVVSTGIISTNAVLTVINPPAVSIGFLRTLVDSSTFLPTASPTQPYEITGIVTTFTNTTSGNTASYFLQDGTGGINIFATLGQTFRPAQGDKVTYVGVLSSFTSGLELIADPVKPYTSYTIISSGNPLPIPKTIPFTVTNTYGFTYVNTNLAGSLVTLTNVFFGTNNGAILSTTANQTLTVTNAAGQTFGLSFFNLDLDTAGQTLPEFATSVTGVLYGLHPNYTLAVTKFSDIVAGTVAPTPIPITTSLSGNSLSLSWDNAAFYLQAADEVAGPYGYISGATSPFVIDVTVAPHQFYRLTSTPPPAATRL